MILCALLRGLTRTFIVSRWGGEAYVNAVCVPLGHWINMWAFLQTLSTRNKIPLAFWVFLRTHFYWDQTRDYFLSSSTSASSRSIFSRCAFPSSMASLKSFRYSLHVNIEFHRVPHIVIVCDLSKIGQTCLNLTWSICTIMHAGSWTSQKYVMTQVGYTLVSSCQSCT